MEMMANSRKLNGISLVECLQHDVKEKEKVAVNQALVDKYQMDDHNPVSKSLKSFFRKLRGSAIVTTPAISYEYNKSLDFPSPTTTTTNIYAAIVEKRLSPKLHSKYIVQKKKTISKSTKNYHLPTIVTAAAEERRKRISYHRHTLDLTTFNTYEQQVMIDSGVVVTHNNSIYSTFTSTIHQSDVFTDSSISTSDSHSTCSSLSFIPEYNNNNNNNNSMKRTHNTVPNLTDYIVDTDGDIEQKLWNEDPSLCPKEEIAQWLGSKPDKRWSILQLYMKNFNFTHQRLDEAFRTLCCKLYLKGESQQLDRILEAFAIRYFECNPNSILHNVDVVHAITYSLLLLNTDLHIVSDYKKMTRNSFIKNTMETVQTLVFPHLVTNDKQRKRRASLVSHQSMIEDSFCLKRNTTEQSPSIISFFDNEENILGVLKSNLSRKPSSLHQKHWLIDVEYLLKDMYSAVKSHRIDQATANNAPHHSSLSSGDTIALYRSRTLPKNDNNNNKRQSLRRRRGKSVIEPPPPVAIIKTSHLKHGLVMRKHVMESTDKRAKHRQWQLCYLIMNEHELIMYRPTQQQHSLANKRKRKSFIMWHQSICSLLKDDNNNMNDWKADMTQEPLGKLEMNHTYASAVPPPGWNGHRPHVFRMETAEGGLWLFESVDMFAIQAWVEAMNRTAASISKGPLTGAVSNMDYGWGTQQQQCNMTECFSPENIPVWHPPPPCMIKSSLSLNDQYDDLNLQIKDFNAQLNEHRQLKLSLDKKFSATTNSMQALANWDRKLHYILHELIKLKCYKESLQQLLLS